MNGAFFHLAVNHIPVLGAPFAGLLLVGGLIFKSRDLVLGGFVALMLIGLTAYPILLTGGKAAQVVWGLPGIAGGDIRAHAEASEAGTWGAIGLGVVALVGFIVAKKTGSVPKAWTVVSLVGALAVSLWMGYVAHLGGLVRHPEIARGFTPPAQAASQPSSSAPDH